MATASEISFEMKVFSAVKKLKSFEKKMLEKDITWRKREKIVASYLTSSIAENRIRGWTMRRGFHQNCCYVTG